MKSSQIFFQTIAPNKFKKRQISIGHSLTKKRKRVKRLFFGTEKVVFHFVIAAKDIIINRSFNLFLLPRKSLVFVLTSFSHYLKSLISETTDKYKKRAKGSDFLDT